MPTYSTRLSQLSKREYRCAGPVDTYTLWTFRVVTRNSNPESHRARPTSPLFLHPTALKLQSTEVQQYGYYMMSENTFVTNEKCNGVWMKVYKDTYNGNNAPGTRQGTKPSTDWALKMRLRIKDTSVNLGTSLVEYRQTARMFSRFSNAVYGAWNDYRKLKKLRFKKVTPCTVAAAELTTSYGIMPLANDLFDSMLALRDRIGNPIYYRFVVTDRATDAFSDRNGYAGKWEVSERAICYVRFLAEEGHSSFTLGNPLELGWEVVPFSFVVDWAIPIGDYLSALDALKGVESVTGTLTSKSWYDHVRVTPPSYGGWLRTPSLSYFDHERTVITSVPLPRKPQWNPSRSWRAVVHGVSLLTSLNQRCRK